MKNVSIQNNSSWTALKLQHQHDEMINFNATKINSMDGISLVSTNAQRDSIDNTTDNYTNYTLTDKIKIDDIIRVDLPVNKYPEQFTTSLLANAYPSISNTSSYVYIFEETERTPTRQYLVGERKLDQTIGGLLHPATTVQTFTWDQSEDSNPIYFTVTLHDQDTCSINHNDNYTNVFMTYNGDPVNGDFVITFTEAPLDSPQENQKFNYYINNVAGFILLYVVINGNVYYLKAETNNLGGFITVPAEEVTTKTLPYDCVLKFIVYKKNSIELSLSNNWVSYQITGDQNNLNINDTKSYKNISNNYLFTSQYHNINDDVMSVDILQLKNQITPTGSQNRNNPFPNLNDCDHRIYDKVHISNTNDENSGLHLNYNSYETEVILKPDAITYFNTPQDMFPYEKININDSNLFRSGAIGGDTPINSDKIFKKAASYKYNTPYGKPTDEETGNWLCSWLKTNVGTDWNDTSEYKQDVIVNFKDKVYMALVDNTGYRPDINPDFWRLTEQPPPVWVDRYYNPRKFSAIQALKLEGQYAEYKSKFDYLIESMDAEDSYIFDKISDLTFEPGSLYAYYRIGPEQISTMIENMSDNLIHDGISPIYSQDRSIINNIESDLTFTGVEYIETTKPARVDNSDFTVSFQMHRDDWSQPFGSQLIGNYTNQGLGIFNKENITPYMIFKTSSGVEVYNTTGHKILSLPLSGCLGYAKLEGNENITLINSVSAITYDMKGMLVEATQFKKNPEKTENVSISSIAMDSEYYYILDPDNQVYRFDISTEQRDFLNRVYPVEGDGSAAPLVIGSTKHLNQARETKPTTDWSVSQNTYIQPVNYGQIQFVINCDDYTVDNDECVWFVKGDEVWKYSLSNVMGVNATWSGVIGEDGDGPGKTEIYLMADENYRGAEGNKINFTGDGTTSIYSHVQTWNESNPGNPVKIIRGNSNSIPADGFHIELQGGQNRDSTGVPNKSLKCSGTINGISADHHNNIFVLYQNTKLVKLDNLRNVLGELDLTDIITNTNITQTSFDMLTEFNQQGVYCNYVLILLRDNNSDDVTLLKIDADSLEIVMNVTVSIPDVNLNEQNNITNFETLKTICDTSADDNQMIFKMRYQSYFDTDKTSVKKLKFNLSNITPGYHHFAFMFNSINSNVSLFVDGVLSDVSSSDDTGGGAAYKFSKTVHDPLLIGADPFFNNITFSEHLGLDNYNFSQNFKLNKVRVFNEYLDFQKVIMLSREGQEIKPLSLTLPTGRRNYIDHATKFYKHRKPGNKANTFDITIVNAGVSASDDQQELARDLMSTLGDAIPINTTVNNINWIS